LLKGNNIYKDLRFISLLLAKGERKEASYLGYVGYGNLGDEALKEAVFELFKDTIIFSESRGFLIRHLEQIGLLRFKLLFLGGGTLILRSEKVLKDISDKSIPQKIIFGTGVANHIFWKDVPGKYGDMKEWMNTLNNVDFLSVRGPISKQILMDKGINKSVHVIGDPVLYFIRDIKSPKPKLKNLGVNIGATGGGQTKDLMWGRNDDHFFSKFIDFIRTMSGDGWQIEFVPVNKNDEILTDNLLIKNGLQKNIKVFRDYTSTQKTIDHMEGFDVFVGQKLHATVLSYCANTPAVMVEYRPKCRDFMASIDMERFNVRTDEFNVAIGKKLVEEMYRDLELIRVKTNKICLDYKIKLIEAALKVGKFINQ